MIRFMLALLLVLAPGCRLERREPPPPPGAAARRAVMAELREYYADFSARDWSRFADHFWDGAIISTAWQPPGDTTVRVEVQTVPGFIERAPFGPGSKEIFAEEMVSADVRISGRLAQAWVRYHARFGDPPDILEWEGFDAFALLRVGERWKIASLTFAAVE